MKRLRRVAGACALAGLLAAPAGAEAIDRHFERTFDVAPGSALRLEPGDGDVEITTWDRDAVALDVTYRATVRGLGSPPDFEVEFEESDAGIRATARERGKPSIGTRIVREHVWVVKAPEWLDVALHGEDGDISIEGLTGPLDVQTQDGDLVLIRIGSTSVRLRTQDGGVELVDCTPGTADVRTQDGDVEATRCSGSFDVRAQDGDVRMQLAAAPGPDVDIRVADGDVGVRLAAGTSAEFLLLTEDGRVEVDLDGVENLRREGPATYGLVGDGTGSIRIQTEDGSIDLRGD